MRMTHRLAVGLLALSLTLVACQKQEAQAPGGGGGFQTSPIPGPPPTELGESYERAYVNMANAYIEVLQEDYNAALPHAQKAQQELDKIRKMGGKTLPATVTQDLDDAKEIVTMIRERNPQVAPRLKDTMISMTNNAEQYDLARPHGAGGGAGTTERETEGPGVAKPEPGPASQPERRPGEGPTPRR
ncbi:hypothetical protein D3C72_1753340 [compost metagenome]